MVATLPIHCTVVLTVSDLCDVLPRLLVGMGAERLFEIFKVEIGYVPSITNLLIGRNDLCTRSPLQHGYAG